MILSTFFYSLILWNLGNLVSASNSLLLPGVAPHSYEQYDTVKLFVDKLTSTKTQIPYEYYSLPFCKPSKKGLQSENVGEWLSGDRIENSIYKVQMKVAKSCEVACIKTLKRSEASQFKRAIEDDYRVHWISDNLPVGMIEGSGPSKSFARGFPVGFTEVKNGALLHYIYNHIRIIIQYHDDDLYIVDEENNAPTTAKIVGFRVEPMSINHKYNGDSFTVGSTVLQTCNSMVPATHERSNFQKVDKGESVIFSYDVFWEPSPLVWANRWDAYILSANSNDKVHWFSITNSILIVVFLTVMIAMILIRALKKDIAKYNESVVSEEDNLAEAGWKLCHGDVFRPPATSPMFLSVFVGTGMQLLLMTFATLTFALLGLLSPTNRGSLTTAFIMLFILMGSFAGYNSSRIYKMFRGTDWKSNTLWTALFFPGIVFIGFITLDIVLLAYGSSGAVPITTLLLLIFLWLCVSVPLVFLGSFFGYKQEAITHPVRTNQIPRQIPPQAWYLHPIITIGVAGILPFIAASVELYFIMSALWLHQIYYIFGFLFLVMIVLIVTCAEISILLCYFQLCNEDYQWWWNSFLSSGSCGFYTFLYSIWYYLTVLSISGAVPTVIYFSYMTMIALVVFLVTGTIGFFSCFWFNTQIYGSIKVD